MSSVNFKSSMMRRSLPSSSCSHMGAPIARPAMAVSPRALAVDSASANPSEEDAAAAAAAATASLLLASAREDMPKSRRRTLRLPLLSSLSSLVELEAVTKKFETLAGRMAMIGVTVALSVEIVAGAPIISLVSLANLGQLGQVTPDLGEELFMSALISAVSFASLLAIESMSSPGRRGQLLLEGVIASLTSIHRSGSAVTALQGETGALDLAVDQIVTSLDVRFDDEEMKEEEKEGLSK